LFIAGHAAAAVAAPATRWLLAEGATGSFFDLFVLIANPGLETAQLSLTYLLPDGRRIVRLHDVPGMSRGTVWVDFEDAALADTAVSTIVESLNAVPVVVERAMWWPGPSAGTWYEAHVSAGSTRSAHRWTVAGGHLDATFVLIANTGPSAASATVTVTYADGVRPYRVFTIAPQSRLNVWVNAEFPRAGHVPDFSVLVESDGELVVERSTYWNSGPEFWAAGTCSPASSLPDAFDDESEFNRAVSPNHHESFDQLAAGSHPVTFALGEVTIGLTDAGAALIFEPGLLDFATNVLSTGVADNGNQVVIRLPAGTMAAGLRLAAPALSGVTVTARTGSGGGETRLVQSASQTFLGFADADGVAELRISSPTQSTGMPTVTIGDILYVR
jgi:hypothetical protein